MDNLIIEKKLGISSDYQYKAINSKNFLQSNWHKNKLSAIDLVTKITKDTRILDLGTGSGNFEFKNAPICKEIVGVDYNDDALAFLRNHLKELNINNVSLYVEDLRNVYKLQPQLGKFDLIVMIDVIEHLPITESSKILGELKNFLNPGGKLIIITPNYQSLWLIIEWLLDKVAFVPKFAGEQHLAKFYKSNTQEILQKFGYKILNITSFNLFSYIFPSQQVAKVLTDVELKLPFCLGNLLLVSCTPNQE